MPLFVSLPLYDGFTIAACSGAPPVPRSLCEVVMPRFAAFRLSLFGVAVGLAATAASAATTVGTQTGAAGNCYPFGCNSVSDGETSDIDYYQVYSASAFSSPITFDTLTFYDSGLNFSAFFNTPPSPELLDGAYHISFSTTSAPLGSSYPISDLANTQDFYLGELYDSPAYSGFSISGASYTYDPSQGNLVMHVVASDQAPTPNNGDNGFLAEDTSGTTLSRAYDETGSGVHADGDGLVTTFSVGPITGAVPEPASWAMMLAGFGLLGGAMRRRRTGFSVA
jgi:hypothetical protein